MKKIPMIFLYVLTSLFLYACSSNPSHNSFETADHSAKQANLPYFTVKINQEQLFSRFSHFANNYSQYQPSEDDVKHIASIKKPLHLLIIFGTWCHDSEREIPRLLKLLHQANNPNITYQMIAVGYDNKISEEYELPVSINYIPTVIISDESGTELTRVIERPERSWVNEITVKAQSNVLEN
jgi:thiol-disulfide isomerase/thioredoxin